MPLGAARLGFLSKHFAVEVAAEVIRKKIGITANGNAQVDTAQSKFGGASALFDGTGDYLLSTDSTLELGSGDWTIEFWFRPGSVSITQILLDFRPDTTQGFYPTIYMVNQALYFYTNSANRITYASSMATGTWYHIAVSKSGSDHKLFFDGSQVGSTYTAANTYLGTRLTIGGDGYTLGSSSTNGHIDEVRISNTARYTTTFTPSTTPFVNDANTQFLAHMDGTDASTVFVDDNGVRAQLGIRAIGNAQVDTAQSKFGGSSALFDGTDDRLEIKPTTTYNDFTVDCWIRLANTSGTKCVMSLGNESTGRVLFAVYNDRIGWDYYGTTSRYGNTSMSTNTWYHLAWSRTGSTIKLFVDGVEQTMTTSSGSGVFPSGAVGNTNGIFIGTLSDDAIDFNGHIDELRLSNTARYTTGFTAPTAPFQNDSNTLLLLHMDGTDGSTVFTDDNGSRTKVGVSALGNAQVDIAQSKFGGSSALFDGTGDYIDFQPAGFTSTENFTYEFWIRFNAVPTSGAFQMIGSSSTNSNRYFAYTNNAGTLRFETGVSGSDGSFYQWWNTTLSTGVWYHIAFVKSGSSLSVYKDGTALTSSGTSGTMTINKHLFNDGVGRIGAWYNAVNSVNGWIDEIRISDTARYTTGFTAPTTQFQNDDNTLLLLHMDGTDASTVFVDDNGVTPNHSY